MPHGVTQLLKTTTAGHHILIGQPVLTNEASYQYSPDTNALYIMPVAPGINTPSLYHFIPVKPPCVAIIKVSPLHNVSADGHGKHTLGAVVITVSL